MIVKIKTQSHTAKQTYKTSSASLGGKSKIIIFVTFPSEGAYKETLSKLRFAESAKNIKQTIARKDAITDEAFLIKYKNEALLLQENIRRLEEKIGN